MTAPKVSEIEARTMPGTPASLISIVQQRVVEREQFGGEVKCQPGELRALIDSLGNWQHCAQTLQQERNVAYAALRIACRALREIADGRAFNPRTHAARADREVAALVEVDVP